jgi:Ohr subfamily peroxiredoxin
VDTSGSTVTASVTIGTIDSGGYGLAVAIDVSLPGTEAAVASELVKAAHQVCPYSNATRDNIEVTLSVV